MASRVFQTKQNWQCRFPPKPKRHNPLLHTPHVAPAALDGEHPSRARPASDRPVAGASDVEVALPATRGLSSSSACSRRPTVAPPARTRPAGGRCRRYRGDSAGGAVAVPPLCSPFLRFLALCFPSSPCTPRGRWPASREPLLGRRRKDLHRRAHLPRGRCAAVEGLCDRRPRSATASESTTVVWSHLW